MRYLMRQLMREAINEGGNQHALHAIKALECKHLERLLVVKVAPPPFFWVDCRGGTQIWDCRGGTQWGNDRCPRRRDRQWSSRQPDLAKPAERPRRREQVRQCTLNTRVGAVRRRAWPLDAKEEVGRAVTHSGAHPEHHRPRCRPLERAHLQ